MPLGNLLKKLSAHVGNPRKSFHAPFARTCSRVSKRAANDVIHLIDGRRNATRSVGAKQLHLAAITASRPTSHHVLSRIFYFSWHSESGRIAHRGNADAERKGKGGRGDLEGERERARGRWYFQFHRAWVNEAHEGRREVRATTLRNFPARRQNWRRRSRI